MVDMIRPDFPGSQAVTQSFLHAAHIATRVAFLANPLITGTARSCWAKTRNSLGPLHPMESHGIPWNPSFILSGRTALPKNKLCS